MRNNFSQVQIADRPIGPGNPVFIIAELSANHNGSLEVAIETIREAKRAGADAIKLQTYTADTLTIDCKNEYFQIDHGTLWDGKTLYNLYDEAHTPWKWHQQLFRTAKEEDLICFSSPFDKSSVDFLENLNTPAFKIASFEIQDIPLIEYVASKGKPIIISTGIAEHEDIELALNTCYRLGNKDIILLKCTSAYPAPLELANIKTMEDMNNRYGVLVGLSDHTYGNSVPIVATSLGACVIEKHFILDKKIGGPDADFSLDKSEFANLVRDVRNAEKALGEITYHIPEQVKNNRKFAKSLFVVKDIKAGERITEENVRSIRPGYGLHPKYLKDVLGKKVNEDIEKGSPLELDKVTF